MLKTLILIPSRMSATRLPGKPLLKIGGISIVSRVFKIAEETNIGDVSETLDNGAGSALNSVIDFFPSNGTNNGTSYRTEYTAKDNTPDILDRMRAR